MKTKITNGIRFILKLILVFIGAFIIIMPFIPAFKEYVFNAPEKEFAFKEVFISLFGVLIFTGGIYSNKLIEATKNRIAKTFNK